MTPKAQKWRDHFADCERAQLQRFPLCQNPLQQLETPLLRAQFEVALSYFKQTFSLDVLRLVNERMKNDANFPRLESYRKATAFRADRATREAFYEHFAKEPLEDFFCLRTEEWDKVFTIEIEEVGWEDRYSVSWHEFTAVSALKPWQLKHFFNSSPPSNIPPEALFLRQWGTQVHPLGGDGGSDVWHWHGEALIRLPQYGSMWIS